MKLIDLEPRFIQREVRQEPREVLKSGIDPLRSGWTDADFECVLVDTVYFKNVALLSEAHGIWFKCPKCYTSNGHGVLCWFPNKVPDGVLPSPRWQPQGSGYNDLSLSPSILLVGGCEWHGFITNGEVTCA